MPQKNKTLKDFFSSKIDMAGSHKYYRNEIYFSEEKLALEERLRLLKQMYIRGIREEQLDEIVHWFAPIFTNGYPPNVYIIGKSGTGKTVTLLICLNEIKELAEERKVKFDFAYINCSDSNSTFKVLYNILNQLGSVTNKIGRNTIFLKNELNKIARGIKDKYLCLLVDEVDSLRDANDLLYYLSYSLPQDTDLKIFLILMTNYGNFYKKLESRVKSRLQCRELIFTPYNAMEIKEILNIRAEKALAANILDEGFIPKCAAYTAQSYGDARKAVSLLYYSVEIARKLGKDKVTKELLDQANEKLQEDKYFNIIRAESDQLVKVIYTCLDLFKTALAKNSNPKTQTFKSESTQIYKHYLKLCEAYGWKGLGQRAVIDILSDSDRHGLLNYRIVSKGRYGRVGIVEIDLGIIMSEKALEVCKCKLGID